MMFKYCIYASFDKRARRTSAFKVYIFLIHYVVNFPSSCPFLEYYAITKYQKKKLEILDTKNESDIKIRYVHYIPFYVRSNLVLAVSLNLIKHLLRKKATNN